MNESPMIRKEVPARSWADVRGEISVYVNFCLLVVCLACGYQGYQALSKTIAQQNTAWQELAISLNRLAYIEEATMAKLEDREPRVVTVPVEQGE